MCGLIYIHRKDKRPAAKTVMKRYHAQKSRGQQGFGYIAIHDNKVVSFKRARTENEIAKLLREETAEEILFHHRLPTSTPNLEEQAHPLLLEQKAISDYSYVIVHNGVITNTAEMKKKHNAAGIEYQTELMSALVTKTGVVHTSGISKWNDSESVAIETALLVEGKQETIHTTGAAAVIGLKLQGTQVIDRFCYRNAMNPLYYHSDAVMTTLLSQPKGVPVTTVHLVHIREDGIVEKHARDVLIPTAYHYPPPVKSNWNSDAFLPSTTQSKLGFDSSRLQPVSNLLKDGYDYVRFYDEDTLWAEYDRTIAKEEELREEIEAIDKRAESEYTSELIAEWEKKQTQLEQQLKYKERLEEVMMDKAAVIPRE